MEGYQWGGGGERGGKDARIKKHNWQVQNRQGKVKNGMGNGETKELICMTHGHELRLGNAGGSVGTEQRGIKWGKWDNCNSIFNKIY